MIIISSIKKIQASDLNVISFLHQKAFKDSELTKLGHEAVRRYYEWQLTGPHECYSISAISEEKIIGFCFAGVFHGALSGYLRKNKKYLVFRILSHPWLILDRVFINRFLIAIKSLNYFPKKTNKIIDDAPIEEKKIFGILSIAVDPAIQTKGVGKVLMKAVEEEAIRQGYDRMHLTVHPSNTNAVQFYLRVGWIKNDAVPWAGGMYKILSAGELS